MVVGILALQGAVQPHREKLKSLGVETLEVRTQEELAKCDRLILPGGESSALIHLLKKSGLWDSVCEFAKTKPTFGFCAGAILLSKRVTSPTQESLGILDAEIERNAFGRQIQSFIDWVTPARSSPIEKKLEAVFIRAPRFKSLGNQVKVLLDYQGEPVCVQEGFCLAATFHPELTDNNELHKYFLQLGKPDARSHT